MIGILGVATAALPSVASMVEAIDAQFLVAWQTRHGSAHRERAAASLAGLLLLQASGLRGELIYDGSGRPRLAGCDCDFNITHSERFVLCAIERMPTEAGECRVGLDAEELSRIFAERIPALVRRWFTPAEAALLSHAGDAETFLRVWTQKEALVKYLGTGLAGLREADTTEAERYGVGFWEYRLERTCVTLCARREAEAPKEIRLLTWEELLCRVQEGS